MLNRVRASVYRQCRTISFCSSCTSTSPSPSSSESRDLLWLGVLGWGGVGGQCHELGQGEEGGHGGGGGKKMESRFARCKVSGGNVDGDVDGWGCGWVWVWVWVGMGMGMWMGMWMGMCVLFSWWWVVGGVQLVGPKMATRASLSMERWMDSISLGASEGEAGKGRGWGGWEVQSRFSNLKSPKV